jgi:hypothetical protein
MRTCLYVAALLIFGTVSAIAQSSLSSTPAKPSQQTAGASAAAQSTASSKIDPAKEADIRKLLEVNGSTSVMLETMKSMMNGLKPLMTQALPAGEYREKLIEVFVQKFQGKINTDTFVTMAVPIFDKYFSHEEIKSMILFYQSPAGRKMAAMLPAVSTELRAAGEQWGRQLGRDAMEEVLDEHPDMKAALEEAGKAQQK